jgi:hypothetical protein
MYTVQSQGQAAVRQALVRRAERVGWGVMSGEGARSGVAG